MFIHTIDRLHNYSIILTRSEQKKINQQKDIYTKPPECVYIIRRTS